jgi:uncharacterized membrane protein
LAVQLLLRLKASLRRGIVVGHSLLETSLLNHSCKEFRLKFVGRSLLCYHMCIALILLRVQKLGRQVIVRTQVTWFRVVEIGCWGTLTVALKVEWHSHLLSLKLSFNLVSFKDDSRWLLIIIHFFIRVASYWIVMDCIIIYFNCILFDSWLLGINTGVLFVFLEIESFCWRGQSVKSLIAFDEWHLIFITYQSIPLENFWLILKDPAIKFRSLILVSMLSINRSWVYNKRILGLYLALNLGACCEGFHWREKSW